MARITAPPHGASFKITRKGYVEGLFIVDGRRVHRNLCRFADVERTDTGRRRTDGQVADAVGLLWEAKRAELEKEVEEIRPSERMMGQVFEAWIRLAQDRGLADGTLRHQRLCRQYYLELVGDHPIEEPIGDPPRLGYNLAQADAFLRGLRDKRVKRGKKERPLGTVRINAYLSRLSSALRFAHERDWLTKVPAIPRPRVERRRPRVPNAEQLKAIVAHLNHAAATWPDLEQRYYTKLHRVLFYLVMGTGMRRGEAHAIQRSQIDLKRRSIALQKTKSGEPRVCRIPKFLRAVLKAHFAEFPQQTLLFENPTEPGKPAWITPAGMTLAFRRLMKRLKMHGAWKALHGYRALFATVAANNAGVSPLPLQRQLGHENIRTTERHYIAKLDEAQLKAVDTMEALFFADLFGGKSGEKRNGKSNVIEMKRAI